MKKRLTIFVIFDSNGIVSEADEFLCKELANVSDRQIICLNGSEYINDKNLYAYTNEIIRRENKGYDGGAVKDVLVDYLSEDEFKSYDELVICNNSFFGPFESFESIFKKMETVECDYWGLTGDDEEYASFIAGVGSYFLVFRKDVLEEGFLVDYFKNYVDSTTMDFNEVIGRYESGLNNYLRKKYSFGIYKDMNHLNIFEAGDLAMMKYHFPILKRKFFIERRTNQERILNALRYLDSVGYPSTYVSGKIKRLYDIDIISDKKEWELPIINESEYRSIRVMVSECDIINFLNSHKKVCVYGTGVFGSIVWGVFAEQYKSIIGFVKTYTDEQEIFHGFPVYSIDELDDDVAVLVALNKKHIEEVRPYLIEKDVLYVF